jgi:hypothetical protein
LSIIPITLVNEPKNYRRRLDVNSGIDDYELTELFTIETLDGYAIVWENIDFSEDRATYIFKCSIENNDLQIQKITEAIKSIAQLRSALSSDKNDPLLTIFKQDYGFITSIRKKRGENKPFSDWLDKLETALKKPIPTLPMVKDVERLKEWTPNNPHTTRINKIQEISYNYKKSAVIKEDELDKTDIFDQENNPEPIPKPTNTVKYSEVFTKRQKILRMLKEFNQYCINNLKLN